MQTRRAGPSIQWERRCPNRILRSLAADCCLTADIPPPRDIVRSMERIQTAPPEDALTFRGDRLGGAKSLVGESIPIHAAWGEMTPKPIRLAGRKSRAAAFHRLPTHFDLGWGRWVAQFVVGFPTSGAIRQGRVSHPSGKFHSLIQLGQLWKVSKKRPIDRPKSSGFKNAAPLWGAALDQASNRQLDGPFEISIARGDMRFRKWSRRRRL